ncbi:hypothetical protein ALC57_06664 [Trachymyrmex cornetzi]|uniref:Uncharacterized protein n=1 Tax=Trachymyrmex cornetzi TaxID=471704 RepID=A0A195E6F7_9HYME|nr:hypothetical protein ALC57_06664 [Trachymyrmex cornetzi]
MLVSKNVALSCQGFVALPATEVTAVPILVHRLYVSSEFYRNIKYLKVIEASKKIASLQVSRFTISLRSSLRYSKVRLSDCSPQSRNVRGYPERIIHDKRYRFRYGKFSLCVTR